jgi:hypothetical protein
VQTEGEGKPPDTGHGSGGVAVAPSGDRDISRAVSDMGASTAGPGWRGDRDRSAVPEAIAVGPRPLSPREQKNDPYRLGNDHRRPPRRPRRDPRSVDRTLSRSARGRRAGRGRRACR